MYATTAAYIVTYVHLLLLTAHLSYLAARYVVDGYSVVFLSHMVTCLVQALFVFILYRGIQQANFSLLRLSLLGLIFKSLLAAAYLFLLVAAQIQPIELLIHMNNFPVLRMFVSSVYVCFMVFSLFTVFRCYRYYLAIQAIIRQKVDGNTRVYECCSSQNHYANRHATFARPFKNDSRCIKFEMKKNGYYDI
ncbi:hypothetical protein L596_003864 [Steinernema carpocapsae]|uniref:Uncharacterized protein n=2 Tax=Steinernema carpocapsae TaxID=34508 RepID=A0A4U8UTT2_STECR|nr:hypothetical protein L596_003864 [Steinernema carpocapsae]